MHTKFKSWRDIPEAQLLLSECAASPPARREIRYRFNENETAYTGRNVTRLKRLYSDHGKQLLAAGDVSGNYNAFHSHCADSVTAAIDEALATVRKVAA